MNNIYTIEDWRRDGTLKVKPGQLIDDEVFYQLRDSVPPTTMKRTCFQPGEAYSMSTDFTELFQTFIQKEEGWLYVGLCPEGSTEPIPEFNSSVKYNENKNYKNMKKNTIKLTENDLHNLIKESVVKVLKESYDINNVYDMGINFLNQTGMSAEELFSEAIDWFGTSGVYRWLEDMYNMRDMQNPYSEDEEEHEDYEDEEEYNEDEY